jgi:hypothetical protein
MRRVLLPVLLVFFVYFERVRAFFVDVLKLSPDAQQPVRLIVMESMVDEA